MLETQRQVFFVLPRLLQRPLQHRVYLRVLGQVILVPALRHGRGVVVVGGGRVVVVVVVVVVVMGGSEPHTMPFSEIRILA